MVSHYGINGHGPGKGGKSPGKVLVYLADSVGTKLEANIIST